MPALTPLPLPQQYWQVIWHPLHPTQTNSMEVRHCNNFYSTQGVYKYLQCTVSVNLCLSGQVMKKFWWRWCSSIRYHSTALFNVHSKHYALYSNWQVVTFKNITLSIQSMHWCVKQTQCIIDTAFPECHFDISSYMYLHVAQPPSTSTALKLMPSCPLPNLRWVI